MAVPRIIAGRLKNRKIAVDVKLKSTPAAQKTKVASSTAMASEASSIRPTSERAREALFDILSNAAYLPINLLIDAKVLDICAGSGAMGIEAISRGAGHVTFIENNPQHMEIIQHNINALGVMSNTLCMEVDACRLPLSKQTYNLVFIDPPYSQLYLLSEILLVLKNQQWIDKETIIVLEYAAKENFILPQEYIQLDKRKYGVCSIIICKLNCI